MSRRTDSRTAELVDIALLTRAAFERQTAEQYALLAGVSARLTGAVLARPLNKLRKAAMVGYQVLYDDRRHQFRL